jgi:amidase
MKVNCLTEIFIERGLARAAELDEYFKRTGKVVGPLHGKEIMFYLFHLACAVSDTSFRYIGLPISLKDQICLKGLDATIGKAFRASYVTINVITNF